MQLPQSVQEARQPPVSLKTDGVGVQLSFDPAQWVLLPRYILAPIRYRQKLKWARSVAEPLGAQYGYGRRSPWVKFLAQGLLLFARPYALTQTATLIRVTNIPDQAPSMRPTTLVVDGLDGDTLETFYEGCLDGGGQPMLRPAVGEWRSLDNGTRAFTASRTFVGGEDSGGSFVSVILAYQLGEHLVGFNTQVGSDDKVDASVYDDLLRLANETRVQLQDDAAN